MSSSGKDLNKEASSESTRKAPTEESIERDYLTKAIKDMALDKTNQHDWEKSFVSNILNSGNLPSISLIHFRFKKLFTTESKKESSLRRHRNWKSTSSDKTETPEKSEKSEKSDQPDPPNQPNQSNQTDQSNQSNQSNQPNQLDQLNQSNQSTQPNQQTQPDQPNQQIQPDQSDKSDKSGQTDKLDKMKKTELNPQKSSDRKSKYGSKYGSKHNQQLIPSLKFDFKIGSIFDYDRVKPTIDGLGKFLAIKVWANFCNADPDKLRRSLPGDISSYRLNDGSFNELKRYCKQKQLGKKGVVVKLKKDCINLISRKDAAYWKSRVPYSLEYDFGVVKYDKVIKPNGDIIQESALKKLRRRLTKHDKSSSYETDNFTLDKKILNNPLVWCIKLPDALDRIKAIKEGRLVRKVN